jgi:hypothetical protein
MNNIVTDPNTGEELEVIDVQLYALNLAEDGRVLSITLDQYGADGQPRVTGFPDDDVSNYRFVDGEFVYDPLPAPPEPEPEPAGEYVTYDELADAIREGMNSYGS